METNNAEKQITARIAASKHEFSTAESLIAVRKGRHIQGKHKTAAVERLLNGEDLLALSSEFGVTAGRILCWKKLYGPDEETHTGTSEGDDLIRLLKRELELLRQKNEELRNELRRMGCTPRTRKAPRTRSKTT
ncbi:MAG: hypothetical protein AB7D27_12175 [Desulfomicrobium sp.]